MDIHKPKPWHSVREFLKEYLIIVVGVLTALGAEQMAETVHWQEKVRQGEVQERRELSQVFAWASERVAVERCLDTRLTTLAKALLAHDGVWTPLPAMGGQDDDRAVLLSPIRPWSDGVWRSLNTDGTATHLSQDRWLLYSRTYAILEPARERNRQELVEGAAFSVLQYPTVLTRPERNALVERIGQERARNRMIAQDSKLLIQNIQDLGPVDLTRTKHMPQEPFMKACAALGSPT
jgi:hypothetical protein